MFVYVYVYIYVHIYIITTNNQAMSFRTLHRFFDELFSNRLSIWHANIEIATLQKYIELLDHDEFCNLSSSLQTSASVQPITNLAKFVMRALHLPITMYRFLIHNLV